MMIAAGKYDMATMYVIVISAYGAVAEEWDGCVANDS